MQFLCGGISAAGVISLSDLINVLLMSACIHMLNALTPLPGDTGWTESAFILIFAVLFGRTEASSVMILWRVATYHIQLIAGGIIFLYVKSAGTKRQRQLPTAKSLP